MSAGVRGSSRHTKIFLILAKFWMSDDHEMTKGLLSNVETLCFTTVFDVRRGHEERVAQTTCPRRKKKEEILKRRKLFEEQPSAAAILSTFLSRLSHQASSAAILCSRPQAISHLAVVSGWWAAVSQPLNINLRWSWAGGRLFLNY